MLSKHTFICLWCDQLMIIYACIICTNWQSFPSQSFFILVILCKAFVIKTIVTRYPWTWKGKRSRGRQRKTWMDNFREDLKERNIDLTRIGEATRNREVWRNLVRASLSARWWKREKKKKMLAITKWWMRQCASLIFETWHAFRLCLILITYCC